MNRIYDFLLRFLGSMSAMGTLAAFLFFAASLTPSLMPRTWVIQGILSGTCAATGYMIGVFIGWLWRYLELPWLKKYVFTERAITLAVAIIVSIVFLWQAVGWQNSIRKLWGLELLDTATPFRMAGIASATFFIWFVLGRLFRLAANRVSDWLDRYVPRRISNVLGVAVAILLFWSMGQGIVVKYALDAADTSFQKADALMETETVRPLSNSMTGSEQSLVSWDGLGRQGRYFVASGPRRDAISDFWKRDVLDPIRVYVGLNNAETVDQRASLALEELKRQGGFERSVLVVIAPTGTGWIDPAAMDPLEYLHKGDVASIALQYSYLTSWLSLLVEPENGLDAASALFHEVYSYWKTLPEDERPRLYLHGLSLGALNSQMSTDIYDVVSEPFQGALWSGPPFRSERWNAVTRMRNQNSPAWLPTFRDGSVIRFSNQFTRPEGDFAPWGPMRFIYLQYASDPVVFFDPASFYQEPQWLKGERGPDVSPRFRWIPVITGLQLVFDMAIATSSPVGFGHVYAPEDYIDAWVSLTDPPDVDAAAVDRLKRTLPASRYQ